PVDRLRIALTFTESEPGEWDRPALAALAPLVAVRGPRLFTLELSARRGNGEPAPAEWAFRDAAGRLLKVPAADLAAELRRFNPILRVQADRFVARSPDEDFSAGPTASDGTPE